MDKFYESIGTVYLYNGEYQAAIEALQSSLKISRVNLGPENANLGNLKTKLGLALKKMGKKEEAMKEYKEAEKILRLTHSEKDAVMSNLLNNISSLLAENGEFEDSIEYRLKDLAICEMASGQSGLADQNTFSCLNNLAVCYFQSGKVQEALKSYEKSLEIAKKLDGVESGEYRQTKDDYEIALSYLEDTPPT